MPDWNDVRRARTVDHLCGHHGLAGYVLRQLGRMDAKQAWYDRADLVVSEKERRRGVLTDLRDFETAKAVLQRAGIAVGEFKGAGLSQQLYGDVGLRVSKDVDAFVHPQNFRAALRLLADNGFACEDALANTSNPAFARFQSVRKDTVVVMPNGGELELHLRPVMQQGIAEHIVWRQDGLRLQLPPATLAFYLLCHGQATSWFRLKWALDAWLVLEGLSETDRGGLRGLIAKSDTGAALDRAQSLLHRIFVGEGGAPFPDFDRPNARMQHRDFVLLSNRWADRWQAIRAHYLYPGPALLSDRPATVRSVSGAGFIVSSGFQRLSKLWRKTP